MGRTAAVISMRFGTIADTLPLFVIVLRARCLDVVRALGLFIVALVRIVSKRPLFQTRVLISARHFSRIPWNLCS